MAAFCGPGVTSDAIENNIASRRAPETVQGVSGSLLGVVLECRRTSLERPAGVPEHLRSVSGPSRRRLSRPRSLHTRPRGYWDHSSLFLDSFHKVFYYPLLSATPTRSTFFSGGGGGGGERSFLSSASGCKSLCCSSRCRTGFVFGLSL